MIFTIRSKCLWPSGIQSNPSRPSQCFATTSFSDKES
jgi:hypothetical protein